ncbi:MAG: hypothetical protein VW380_02000, partial [Candidatus Woesearchaeota archaeon]
MKRLIPLVFLIPSIYANEVNDAFNSALNFITPDIANWMISFFLVYGAALIALNAVKIGGDNNGDLSKYNNVFAAALGFAAAFTVYYSQFNVISFLAPWMIFIVVG